MRLDILKKEEAQKIKELLFTYEFNDYSTYRMLDREKLKDFLFNQILTLLKFDKNWVVVAYEKEKVVGLATLSFLFWDTKHFGFNMAKIDYLMARGDYTQAAMIKNKLLSYLFQICKNSKITHLSCRININDISSIHALERNGFTFMDTLVTYIFNRYRHKVLNIKELYKVRGFKKKDLQILADIAKEVFSKDRFHLDPHIPHMKANDLFSEWVRNCSSGGYADKIFVAESRKQPVGFLTFKLNKELERFTKYKIAGRGLSAVLPGAKGVYPCLVKAAIQDIILHYDYLEFDTQLNNYEVIKVWQRFGFNFIRAKYTFHKWLS